VETTCQTVKPTEREARPGAVGTSASTALELLDSSIPEASTASSHTQQQESVSNFHCLGTGPEPVWASPPCLQDGLGAADAPLAHFTRVR
jgi:hypothetical protein